MSISEFLIPYGSRNLVDEALLGRLVFGKGVESGTAGQEDKKSKKKYRRQPKNRIHFALSRGSKIGKFSFPAERKVSHLAAPISSVTQPVTVPLLLFPLLLLLVETEALSNPLLATQTLPLLSTATAWGNMKAVN